ncbi:creatininase family protein [Halosimplex marinum]|uniref:creatininase family protein n=1 Tax=Halosimplex marinum TaxID=3396620 RepID=UPI003F54EDC7
MAYDCLGAADSAWAGRTAPEIVETADADGSVLVLPIGSIEQHGHHLPVATDTILADAVAQEGVERVADDVPILCAPPFWAGYSPHHLAFGGTLTLEFETMREAVEDVADAALSNGFDALVLVNGHGGNKPLVGAATSTVGADHPEAEVLGLTYFDLAEGFVDEVRDSETGGMSHGGEFETSLMLHLRPDLVREDAMDAPNLDEPYDRGLQDLFGGGAVSVYRGFDEYSETGAIGAPSDASAEKGERLFDRLGDELGSLLREVHANNR